MASYKLPKKSAKKSASSPYSGDSRFAAFESDPRFKLPSKRANRTTIDKRFSRLLQDEDFTARAKVDKYGRKLKSDAKKRALQNLYRDEDEDQEDCGERGVADEREREDDHVVQKRLAREDAKYDPARGGGFSSSESESESDEEEGKNHVSDATCGKAGTGDTQRLRDEQADVETGEVTKRIAIVNLDWDHIKSADLMAVFSSFVPEGGRIDHISIYPSEFGKERMQREELEGPPREIFKEAQRSQEGLNDDSEDLSEEGSDVDGENDEESDEAVKQSLIQEGNDREDFDSAALRSYQLDRLRYFYAVMVCSDASTAHKIYQATDGSEYQTTGLFLDLRFVPDDVTFDDDPRDVATRVPQNYRPTEFVTDALQHSKVRLTWDMHPEETTRRRDIKRAFTGKREEIEENDMRAYLASDTEEDVEVPDQGDDCATDDKPKLSKKEAARQRMRQLLGLVSEGKVASSASVGELEVTFAPNNLGDKKPELVGKEETTIEKYKRREREKKTLRKQTSLAKRAGVQQEDVEEATVTGPGEDLGFDDPFFASEKSTQVPKASQRKEERLRKRQVTEAEAEKNAAERSKLKQVMTDDSKDVAEHLEHFDMNEISRAEKLKAKKGKKKSKKGLADRGGLQDGFKMDVEDDRFQAIFQSHEYAIDPTDTKFKATPGMKTLLEEVRSKRGVVGDEPIVQPTKKSRRP